MRRSIVTLGLLAVVLFLSAERQLTFAQEPPVFAKPTECAFDSYGNINAEDQSARLDNFAIQLLNQPEAYGYIVVWAPESASKRIRQNITDYLVKTRDLPRKKVKTYHAGYNSSLSEPWIQLWVVPKGAELPKVAKPKVNLAAFKGMLAEYRAADHIELVSPNMDWEEDLRDSLGPPVGNVRFAAFEDVLKAQKHSVGHVVAFNGAEEVPGTWRRVAESAVADLKRFGIAASRFKIAYGGQSKETKVQLWVLPAGETPPIEDPASEPIPAKAIQVGEYDNSILANPKNERAVFDRLVMVMRENPDLRACLIVRMETTSQDPVDDSADLPKLVEKWKNDLLAKHKIRADRIVVLFANAEEYHLPSIEIWVIAPNVPLPDLDQ